MGDKRTILRRKFILEKNGGDSFTVYCEINSSGGEAWFSCLPYAGVVTEDMQKRHPDLARMVRLSGCNMNGEMLHASLNLGYQLHRNRLDLALNVVSEASDEQTLVSLDQRAHQAEIAVEKSWEKALEGEIADLNDQIRQLDSKKRSQDEKGARETGAKEAFTKSDGDLREQLADRLRKLMHSPGSELTKRKSEAYQGVVDEFVEAVCRPVWRADALKAIEEMKLPDVDETASMDSSPDESGVTPKM